MWRIEPTTLGRVVTPPHIPAGFAVFCTTRDFQGRITSELAKDITSVARELFGVESALATCTQLHSATVRRAERASEWRECDACDALWSDERRVALAVKIADCLPVSIIDPVHSVIANVHSGWRGAAQRITSQTIDRLEESSSFAADASFAYLGPSIRACCFEVGDEVATQFDERFLDRTHAKAHVDLPAMTANVLRERGFADERIFDSGLCTRCEGSIFHSYRRHGGGGGRNLAIVAQ